MTTCEEVRDEIWALGPGEQPGRSAAEHLRSCDACQDEEAARLASIAAVRAHGAEEPPDPAADRRVLGHVQAVVGHMPARPSAAGSPSVSIAWMTSAAAILLIAVSLGFIAGRTSATPASATPVSESPTLVATPTGWPRPHSVSLSADTLESLRDGHTYLLAGPPGGPYRMLGAVRFEAVDPPSGPAPEELIVAVGPSAPWSPGDHLAVNDLSEADVAIVGRRALAKH